MFRKKIKRKNKKILRNYKISFDDYTLIEFYDLVNNHVEDLKRQIAAMPSIQDLPNLIRSRNIFMQLSVDFGFSRYEEDLKNLKPVYEEVDYLCGEWLEQQKEKSYNSASIVTNNVINEVQEHECL
jgi:hypothetical protein